MFDESILELEAIEFGEDRWHPLVIEARYKTYRDAKEWELAKIMADLLTKRFPDQVEWLINKSEAIREMGDPLGAIQTLKDVQDRFAENVQYLFAVWVCGCDAASCVCALIVGDRFRCLHTVRTNPCHTVFNTMRRWLSEMGGN